MQATNDVGAEQIDDWLASLNAFVAEHGSTTGQRLVEQLNAQARGLGLALPANLQTPYVNTIPLPDQPPFPGDREIERRIKNIMRWNAMAMVVHANKHYAGIGGHISTYASVATLLEVAFHHFFRAAHDDE